MIGKLHKAGSILFRCTKKQKNSRQTDTKGRDCASAMIPLNLNNASYKSGTKLTNVMNNAMLDKYDPVTGDYKGSVDLKKLGKYNYFKFVIYDIDAKGGYDTPAIYYFRFSIFPSGSVTNSNGSEYFFFPEESTEYILT